VIRPLKQSAVEKAVREIRLARYLSCTVTTEELVRRAVTVYEEAAHTPRPRPRKAGA
jgi:hypothetical protein